MSLRQPTWHVNNEGSFASVSITLQPSSSIHCESDAVITMSQDVNVRGAMSGGILAGLARAFFTRESFFTTKVHNNSTQSGNVLLAPSDPGGVTLHRLGGTPGNAGEMTLTSGAYLAADEAVTVASSMQSPFSTFGNCSGTGVFLLRASGQGVLAISAYGSMHKYTLAAGEMRSVDNGHLVAWTSSMKTSMKLASAGIVGSMTSGEGLHCSFEGPGVVYIQSHKPKAGPDGVVRNRNGGGNSGNPFVACIVIFVVLVIMLGFLLAVYFGTTFVPGYDSNGGNGYGQQQYGGDRYRRNEF